MEQRCENIAEFFAVVFQIDQVGMEPTLIITFMEDILVVVVQERVVVDYMQTICCAQNMSHGRFS